MSFAEDIVGIVELLLRFVVEMLKRFEEKEDLFAIFPIGATIQDGGKRDGIKDSRLYLFSLLFAFLFLFLFNLIYLFFT